MPERLVLIHAVPALIGTFNQLGSELLPGVQLLHVLDEMILERVRQRGSLDEADVERLRNHVASAERVHASGVLVTCSMLSPCVDEVQPELRIPLIKIDDAMVQRAVALGARIGMVATNIDTLEPSAQLLYEHAARIGKAILVVPGFVPNAFAALRNGDGATHDRLVKAKILELAPSVDLIVLAQASMARVLDALGTDEVVVPILSSPHLALEQVRVVLAQRGAPTAC